MEVELFKLVFCAERWYGVNVGEGCEECFWYFWLLVLLCFVRCYWLFCFFGVVIYFFRFYGVFFVLVGSFGVGF